MRIGRSAGLQRRRDGRPDPPGYAPQRVVVPARVRGPAAATELDLPLA
jgi:hypothetical protein